MNIEDSKIGLISRSAGRTIRTKVGNYDVYWWTVHSRPVSQSGNNEENEQDQEQLFFQRLLVVEQSLPQTIDSPVVRGGTSDAQQKKPELC